MLLRRSWNATPTRACDDWEDAQIDALFESVKADVVRGIQGEGGVASNLVEALMLAKYLERVGDHAQNIAEWVEYALTGRYKGEVLG